jgi:hypothetical protein
MLGVPLSMMFVSVMSGQFELSERDVMLVTSNDEGDEVAQANLPPLVVFTHILSVIYLNYLRTSVLKHGSIDPSDQTPTPPCSVYRYADSIKHHIQRLHTAGERHDVKCDGLQHIFDDHDACCFIAIAVHFIMLQLDLTYYDLSLRRTRVCNKTWPRQFTIQSVNSSTKKQQHMISTQPV